MNVGGGEMIPFEAAAGVQATTAAATAMPKTPTAIIPKAVLNVAPMPLDKVTLTPAVSAAATGGGFMTGLKNVVLAPFRGVRNLFSSKPTVSASTGVSVQRYTPTGAESTAVGATASAAKGAAAGGTAAAAASSKSGLRAMIDEVLPKAEPASAKLLGKRVLASMAFGIIGNTIKSGYYIATGKWSGGQAWQFMLRDTVKGAVGGAAFGLGLGLTTMALTPLGVAGIPLIIAGMAGGSVLSLGSLQLLAQYDGWDWGYI